MPFANPFTNPPRLPSPTKGRYHSRSASRSPVRQHARDFDPLLRDLSPTTTLRAFVADPNEMSVNSSDALARSIQSSSHSERALGAKAAQACLDLRTWTQELEGWEWPGAFDVPEPARKKMRISTYNSVPLQDTIATNEGSNDEEELEYWGSLPARTVRDHERRADEIGLGLDQIDVEELKDYVLSTHYRADSRPSSRDDSIASISSTTDIKRLDDYTALVTATILQALPFLSRINRLLDIWTIRLIILRSAPNYLRELKRARMDLDHGWAAIALSPASDTGRDQASFDRNTMQDMKIKIEQHIRNLGRRLDRFLDDLEGRDDTVPDTWVDDFELLEAAYGAWVVQAERKVLENEWRAQMEQHRVAEAPGHEIARSENHQHSLGISETEDPALDDDAVVRLSTDQREVDEPAEVPGDEELEEARSPDYHNAHREINGKLNRQPIPTLVATDSEVSNEHVQSAPVSAGTSREPSPVLSSVSKEDGISGQVAKRRAAFLNDIERTNSLKQATKSPVRPFEHASNAFTRLFKKDRSPEQIKSKRSMSSRISSIDSGDNITSPAERKPLSPLSVASSKLNAANIASSAPSAASSSRMSKDASADAETAHNKNVVLQDDTHRQVEPLQEHLYHARDHHEEHVSMPDRKLPETYQPTGLSSPFHSPEQVDLPADWPLALPAEALAEDSRPEKQQKKHRQPIVPVMDDPDSGPEIDTPKAPMETDAFDRIFIQSFPKPPAERAPDGSAPPTGSERRAASVPRHGSTASYLDNVSVGRSRPKSSSHSSSQARRDSASEPPPLPLVAEVSSPASAAENSAGNPEYLSAAKASRSRSSDAGDQRRSSLPPNPGSLKLKIPGSEPDDEAVFNERPVTIKLKRASTTSIEAFPRSELKSINVHRTSRHNSVSPRVSPPPTPKRPQTPEVEEGSLEALNTSPMTYKGMVAFPTPPPRRSSVAEKEAPPRADTPNARCEASPLVDKLSGSPLVTSYGSDAAPLNAAMAKRRGKQPRTGENRSPSHTASPTGSPVKRFGPPNHGEDNFDRHVSEVLETLPAQIKFKVRPGAETPAPQMSDVRENIVPRAKQLTARVPSKSSGMTIVPAETSPKKSSSASDPEVKLYHLTTAGRDEPIKLFVRLVGEGERVMVRVGGGWADLADYLRQYAEHHGSRTVSEGNLEVQTMTSAPVSRKVSNNAEFRAKTPVMGTSRSGDSDDSDKDWSVLPGLNGGTPVSAALSDRQTPTHTSNTRSSTPKSTSSSSRPSTANLSRPPSRQNTGEVGLAGPSSGKKAGLSEHKAKWVEGMIERAKKASAEKSKVDKEKYFGELGKAGGTRRVIFRSASGVQNGEKTTK